jgi:hypothetical protein
VCEEILKEIKEVNGEKQKVLDFSGLTFLLLERYMPASGYSSITSL